jgi:hemerythrin-like domain-containing protein
MSRPTSILMDEHRVIKKMLKVIENICHRLREGEKVPREDLSKVINFIRTFADKCHHGKEEDLLFPAMEEAGVPKESGPIGVMLTEHEVGRKYVRNMKEAIENLDESGRAVSDFIDNAEGYIQLLEQHIYKEDNILYPMADNLLTEEKMKDLLKRFNDVEEKIVGPGVHEEMHKLVEYLANKYL